MEYRPLILDGRSLEDMLTSEGHSLLRDFGRVDLLATLIADERDTTQSA